MLRSHAGKNVPVTFIEVAAGTTPSRQYLLRASAIMCIIDVVDRESLEPVRHTLHAFAHTRRHDLTPLVVGAYSRLCFFKMPMSHSSLPGFRDTLVFPVFRTRNAPLHTFEQNLSASAF